MTYTTEKETVYYLHRVNTEHDYECYGNQTISVGKVLHRTKTPNRYKTYSQVIGHGMSENIPQHKVDVVKINKKVETTITETIV